MASVKRRHGSRYWVICYDLPNGTRKQVSSRLEDRNLALQLALKLERAAGVQGRGAFTRDFALALVDDIASLADVPLVDPTSTRDFVDGYFGARAKIVAPKTARKYDAWRRDFLSFLGAVADRPIGEIAPALVAGWRDRRLAAGLAPATVKASMIALEAAFGEAVDQQRLSSNPFAEIKKPKLLGSEIKKAFTWEQFRALLAATDGEWRTCILIAGFTGQRQQDVAQLEWEQVDFTRRVIVFRREKNDDEYPVPMHHELADGLALWHAARGRPSTGKVLPEIAALPRTTGAAFPAVFRFKILPRIGIVQPYVKRAGARGRAASEYSFHSLRHMLSTELNAAGVSEETRMLIVGHADRRVSAGYTHAKLEDAARALELLPPKT